MVYPFLDEVRDAGIMTRSTGPAAFDPADDERLVARCLEGDGRAWQAIVLRYERLVYAVARSYRLSDQDLGDVFQEVFSALVRGMPRLREPRTLCRWLSSTTERIARATALRVRREQARTQPEDTIAARSDPDADPPDAGLERFEEQALVRLALERLGDRCRVLLRALYYEDPPPAYTTLARRLGMPIGSLGPNRARCIERLQQLVRSMAPGDPRITPGSDATSRGERVDPSPESRRRPGRERRGDRPPSAKEAG